jgi:hypothetical protein
VTGIWLLRQGAPDTVMSFDWWRSRSISRFTVKAGLLTTQRRPHQYGATRDEVVETVAVALYVRGGPSPSHHLTAILRLTVLPVARYAEKW